MEENLTIAEVIQQHPDEWLLFEVLERDAQDLPTQGRLLYHGKNRDELHQVAMAKLCPDNLVIFTGDPCQPDVEVVIGAFASV